MPPQANVNERGNPLPTVTETRVSEVEASVVLKGHAKEGYQCSVVA